MRTPKQGALFFYMPVEDTERERLRICRGERRLEQ
jgi:hypothetical protein